jgi:hypothetical protein
MQHPLQCRCGTIKGHVARPELANRVVCYCGSCQAFAHFLGSPTDILDSHSGVSIGNAFGDVRARVNTQDALGLPKPKTAGVGRIIWWFVTTVLKARVDGSYRQTPFFLTDTGKPRVSPHVLTTEELVGVKALLEANKNRSSAR